MKNPPIKVRPLEDVKPVESRPTACPMCESTEREPYHNTVEHEFAGEHPVFGPYTHVVFRRTECKNCGQHRIDKAYENRV